MTLARLCLFYTESTGTEGSLKRIQLSLHKSLYARIYRCFSFSVPGVIRNLKLKRNDDLSVTLSWMQPQDKGGPDLKYFVRVNNGKGFYMNAMNYTIKQEKETTKYFVSVSGTVTQSIGSKFTVKFNQTHRETNLFFAKEPRLFPKAMQT